MRCRNSRQRGGLRLLWGVLGAALLLWPAAAGAAPGGEATARRKMAAQRAEARGALSALGGERLQVDWPEHRSRPAVVRGLDVGVAGADAKERAVRFAEGHPGLLGGVASRLVVEDVRGTRDVTVVRLQQTHRGIPVVDGEARVMLDASGRVRGLQSEVEPVSVASVTPRITAHAAVQAALQEAWRSIAFSTTAPLPSLKPTLAILRDTEDRLVFRVVLPLSHDPAGRIHFVDAKDGTYRGHRPGMLVERLPQKEVRR